MRWRRILSRVVAAPLLLSSLISLYTQGEWFAQSAWVMLPFFGFVLSLFVGLLAVATREWRTARSCALMATFSLCFFVGLQTSGRLVFRVSRHVVQRSSEQLVPSIEALHEASLEAPTFGSARSVYFRDDDGSFGFVICDPGCWAELCVGQSQQAMAR
jgi:hypothetical protein